MKKPIMGPLGFLIISTTWGCSSLIFGNIKPYEDKSQTYSILDISKDNPAWKKLTPAEKNTERGQGHDTLGADASDMAFVSKESDSTISLNSACKNYLTSDRKSTLQKLTDELLTGTLTPQSIISKSEKEIVIQDSPALQTITKGVLNGRNYVIESVVLQFGNCIFDLIYVARAEKFEQHKKDFSRFVSSLRFK